MEEQYPWLLALSIASNLSAINMPPNKNIKKGAAALFQNSKEIERAFKNGATCGAVTKRLGNGGFTVQLSSKKSVMGTPRGLFTSGTMRISVGQIVIVVGTDRAEGDSRPALPWEIVARVDDKATAKLLVKSGCMPAEVLSIASSAGVIETAALEADDDDLFEDDDFWQQGQADLKGGMKAERKAQEAEASIAARVASLKSGRKGIDGGVVVGSLTDPSLNDEDYERFKRWRANKAKAITMSIGGSVARPASEQNEEQLMAQLLAQFKAEAAAAEAAAAAAAHAQEVRSAEAAAWIAAPGAKENWDDEISINDL